LGFYILVQVLCVYSAVTLSLQVYNGSLKEPYTNPKAPVHIITGSAVGDNIALVHVINIHVLTCTHAPCTRTHTYMHAHTHTYIHTHATHAHTHTYIHMHAYTCTLNTKQCVCLLFCFLILA
jgi:hypothetical protein